MLTDLQHVRASAAPDISPSELEYIAFSGERDLAHGIFRSIPPEYRGSFCNRYILSEVMTAGVTKLRKFLSASAEDAAMEEKLFVDQTARLFLSSCRQTGTFPRELFESLLLWANELAELSLLRESLSYHNDMVAAGIRKFPDLNVRCMMDRANLLNKTGDVAAAQELFNTLAERPYLLADRDAVPELMFNLGRESLLKGDITLYKSVLFQGLRHFYTTIEDRRRFVDQLRSTYRYSTRVFLDRKIRMTDRFLFAVHLLYFKSRSVRFLEAVRVSSLLKVAVLGYVYWLNYVHRRGWTDLHQVSRDSGAPARDRFVVRRKGSVRKSVLITRAMGGIGDLLMMTPGLHALKQKIGDNQIILAVPKRYFPVFEGNPDVELADIEDGKLDYSGHRKWLNFSDCPASRVESRTAPRVRKSRIEIFAAAMGIGPLGRIRMDHRPRYFLSERDRLLRQTFWKNNGLNGSPVVGVQLHADESYRDYPHMERIVEELRDLRVITFQSEPLGPGANGSALRVAGLSLRDAFAIASGCDVIVAPDSAFVHFAAALGIPCVALYGPIDGIVRIRHYPECTFLDLRAQLGCVPCWRNEKIPCKLTGMRGSICLADLKTDEVVRAVRSKLREEGQP